MNGRGWLTEDGLARAEQSLLYKFVDLLDKSCFELMPEHGTRSSERPALDEAPLKQEEDLKSTSGSSVEDRDVRMGLATNRFRCRTRETVEQDDFSR